MIGLERRGLDVRAEGFAGLMGHVACLGVYDEEVIRSSWILLDIYR